MQIDRLLGWVTLAGTVAIWGPRQAMGQDGDVHYHIARRFDVVGHRADYLSVDPVGRRLYGATNKVIDIDRNMIVGELPPNPGDGFLLIPSLGKGISNDGLIFDLKTLQPLSRMKDVDVETSAYDPITQRAFLFGDENLVVDMRKDTVLATLPLSTLLRQPVADSEGHSFMKQAVADGDGHVFVSVLTTSGAVVEVDAHTMQATARWDVPQCKGSWGLAIDPAHHRLFLSCLNHAVVVLDSRDGHVVTTLPVGSRGDAIAFEVSTQLLFNPNSDGTMSVFRETTPDRYEPAGIVNIGEGDNFMTIDEKTHNVYVMRKTSPGMLVLALVRDK